MSLPPVYVLDGVTSRYADRTVLDIPHLEINAGEILAVVGPSGAGKSTLLRLLNFLERPTSGEIYYHGQVLPAGGGPLAWRREVTTVFQRPILTKDDVRSNVAYGLWLRKEVVDGRVTDLLSQVGLSGLANAPARKLSGGEMQRVALARALVINPSVLLLDEPTANLDPYNVGLIEDIVLRRNRELKTTVVLVTHNVFQARRLAHRAGLLLSGQLIEVGPAHSFFESPLDPRTAAFVRGDMVY